MKRRIAFVLFSLALVGALAYSQTYTVVSEEYAPYEYMANGKPAGLDIEVLALAAQKAGVTLNYQFVPWARAENMVKTGSAEAILSLFKTPEREQFLYYPATNLSVEKNAIFAGPAYKANATKLSDLKGQTIGTCVGYSYGPVFDAFKDYVKDENSDTETLMKKLVNGRTLLAVNNVVVGLFTLDALGAKGITVLPIDLGSSPLYIGFSKAAPKGKELLDKLQPALAELEKLGELDKIRKRYMK